MIKSHIIGRLGKDCEEATQGQRQVLRFSVATDEREKDKDGNWVKKTVWVSVSTYQTGLKPYLTKGKQVMVSGDLHLGVWTRNDGTASIDAAVFGGDVTLLGGDNASQDAQNAPQPAGAQQSAVQAAAAPYAPPQPQGKDYADDLPF